MVCKLPLGLSFVVVVKLLLLLSESELDTGGLHVLPVVESFSAAPVPHRRCSIAITSRITTSLLSRHSHRNNPSSDTDSTENNSGINEINNNNCSDDNMEIDGIFGDRRSMLIQAATVITVMSSPLPVYANTGNTQSIFSSLQAPIQDIISPGHWLGQFVGINSRTVEWTKFPPPTTKEEASKALVEVINDLTPIQLTKLCMPNYAITTSTTSNVHVRTWTKNEWLDSLDVQFIGEKTTCTAKASFYATGFVPTSIPGAPIINTAFAWFPFASPGPGGEMLQDYRLRVLEALLIKKLKGQAKV